MIFTPWAANAAMALRTKVEAIFLGLVGQDLGVDVAGMVIDGVVNGPETTKQPPAATAAQRSALRTVQLEPGRPPL